MQDTPLKVAREFKCFGGAIWDETRGNAVADALDAIRAHKASLDFSSILVSH